MKDLDAWLREMSTKPAPGGVAAAAVAAAMGGALVTKAIRVTLKHQSVSERDRGFMQEALDLAAEQSEMLLGLSKADTEAVRAVLELPEQASHTAAGLQAWQEAIDVPLRVAEVCQEMLDRLPRLLALCWPAVYPDLKTAEWLLEVGLKTGRLSAETNVQAMGEATGDLSPQYGGGRRLNGRETLAE
jgi:formiminotetrahydrofolate cyclodeaminase